MCVTMIAGREVEANCTTGSLPTTNPPKKIYCKMKRRSYTDYTKIQIYNFNWIELYVHCTTSSVPSTNLLQMCWKKKESCKIYIQIYIQIYTFYIQIYIQISTYKYIFKCLCTQIWISPKNRPTTNKFQKKVNSSRYSYCTLTFFGNMFVVWIINTPTSKFTSTNSAKKSLFIPWDCWRIVSAILIWTFPDWFLIRIKYAEGCGACRVAQMYQPAPNWCY